MLYSICWVKLKSKFDLLDREESNFRVDFGWPRVWSKSTRMVETSPTMYDLCFYDVGNILVHVWYSPAREYLCKKHCPSCDIRLNKLKKSDIRAVSSVKLLKNYCYYYYYYWNFCPKLTHYYYSTLRQIYNRALTSSFVKFYWKLNHSL